MLKRSQPITRRIRRGDIFSADLGSDGGSEQGKARPAFIIPNDIGNQFDPTVIVAALTSGRQVPFDVNVAVESP